MATLMASHCQALNRPTGEHRANGRFGRLGASSQPPGQKVGRLARRLHVRGRSNPAHQPYIASEPHIPGRWLNTPKTWLPPSLRAAALCRSVTPPLASAAHGCGSVTPPLGIAAHGCGGSGHRQAVPVPYPSLMRDRQPHKGRRVDRFRQRGSRVKYTLRRQCARGDSPMTTAAPRCLTDHPGACCGNPPRFIAAAPTPGYRCRETLCALPDYREGACHVGRRT